jgi:hypothetical protein
VYTDSVTESSHFFLFPLFVAALAGFFAATFAGLLAFVFSGLGLRRWSGFGLRLWLWFALGPRRRRFGGLRAAGENLGDANHRELVAIAALAARILAAGAS